MSGTAAGSGSGRQRYRTIPYPFLRCLCHNLLPLLLFFLLLLIMIKSVFPLEPFNRPGSDLKKEKIRKNIFGSIAASFPSSPFLLRRLTVPSVSGSFYNCVRPLHRIVHHPLYHGKCGNLHFLLHPLHYTTLHYTSLRYCTKKKYRKIRQFCKREKFNKIFQPVIQYYTYQFLLYARAITIWKRKIA